MEKLDEFDGSNIFENATDPILVTDNRGIIEVFNQAAEDLLKYHHSEILGQNFNILLPQPERSQFYAYPKNHFITAEKNIRGTSRTLEALTKYNDRILIELSISPFTRRSQRKFLGIMREVREISNLVENIRESEESYKDVFESSPVGIVQLEDEQIIMANPEFYKMYNLPTSTTLAELSQIITDFLPLTLQYKIANQIPLSRRDGEMTSISKKYKHEGLVKKYSGESFEVEIKERSMITNQQSRMLLLFLDISIDKQLVSMYEKDLDWMKKAIEIGPYPIMICDSKGVVKILNKPWIKLNGYTLDETLTLNDLVIQRVLYFDDESTSFNHEIITSPGKRSFWNLNMNSFNLEGHGSRYIFILATNVTEILEAKKQLAVVNQEVQEFAHVISHDFRTPIRNITSYIDLFRDKSMKKFDAVEALYLERIRDGAIRLDKLSSGLIEFARTYPVEGHHAGPNTIIKLTELFENLLTIIFPHAFTEKKAVIHFDLEEDYILGFEAQIFRLFQNLLSNALKFVPKSTTPVITIMSRKMKNGFVEIQIIDNGIGIPDNATEKIFTVFKRLKTHDEYSGSGIGLAISKKIVQQHGGSIEVKASANQGSTFVIKLPGKGIDLDQSSLLNPHTGTVGFEFKHIKKVCFFMNDGRLIQSYSLENTKFILDDPSKEILFSASLMIINNFIQETSNSDEPFYEMKSKDQILIYEKGRYLSCCIVTSRSYAVIRNALRLLIFQLEYELGNDIKNWDGQINSFNFESYLYNYFN